MGGSVIVGVDYVMMLGDITLWSGLYHIVLGYGRATVGPVDRPCSVHRAAHSSLLLEVGASGDAPAVFDWKPSEAEFMQ